MIDKARPGEEVEVTGIYKNSFDSRLNSKHGFPVFSTVIEANYVSKKSELSSSVILSEEDEMKIKDLAKDDKIGERVNRTIFNPALFNQTSHEKRYLLSTNHHSQNRSLVLLPRQSMGITT